MKMQFAFTAVLIALAPLAAAACDDTSTLFARRELHPLARDRPAGRSILPGSARLHLVRRHVPGERLSLQQRDRRRGEQCRSPEYRADLGPRTVHAALRRMGVPIPPRRDALQPLAGPVFQSVAESVRAESLWTEFFWAKWFWAEPLRAKRHGVWTTALFATMANFTIQRAWSRTTWLRLAIARFRGSRRFLVRADGTIVPVGVAPTGRLRQPPTTPCPRRPTAHPAPRCCCACNR